MSKLIVVSDMVYQELEKAKGKNLSFSKIIAILIESYKKSSDTRKYAGSLKNVKVDAWIKEVEEGRRKGFKRSFG
ncbi:MAG: hypothetical protein KGH54_03015 [Candidatus Micrarchaeota archaeon]|nr:hypothetical protein [Candidatus Micrarchaeota archaeon]